MSVSLPSMRASATAEVREMRMFDGGRSGTIGLLQLGAAFVAATPRT